MALTFGFYNSIDDDRLYDATDFSDIFDGIINDGIFQNVGDAFIVSAGGGMSLIIGSGRAWLNGTWTYNDASYILQVPESEVLYDRIDTVVIQVDKRQSYRQNSITIISGTPGVAPSAPELESGPELFQYPLADIYVAQGVESIYATNITNRRGTNDLPFVTGILSTVSVSSLLTQWQAEYESWMSTKDNAFNTLYSNKENSLNNLYNTQSNSLSGLYSTYSTDLSALYNTWADRFQELYDDFVLQVDPDSSYTSRAGAIWLSTT